jgi:uncharacterized membrane protein YtjA (UPF0391 family)
MKPPPWQRFVGLVLQEKQCRTTAGSAPRLRSWSYRGECQKPCHSTEFVMLKWALIFALVSIVAGVLGFSGIAAGAAGVAKLLFVVALIVFLIFLSLGLFVVKAVD